MSKTCCFCLASLLLATACAVDSRALDVASQDNRPGATSDANPGNGITTLPPGAGSDVGATPPAGGSSGMNVALEASCGEARAALPSPLDLLLQLDSSASMLEPLASSAPPLSKWEAVRQALVNFVQAPENAETGLGLSYFPQVVEGVPTTCATNADCLSAGPCSKSVCVQSITAPAVGGQSAVSFLAAAPSNTPCGADAECESGQSCRALGGVCMISGAGVPALSDSNGAPVTPLCNTQADCAGVGGTTCEELGTCGTSLLNCTPTFACPATMGDCTALTYTCLQQTRCELADYSTPAVPISIASLGGSALLASLAARLPEGLTPTGPALSGALAHAALWARQHPERRVATVLATDGFPTTCQPLDIAPIAELAAAAAQGEQPIQTFVVGIFGGADLGTDGRTSLDQLAAAGATERAWLADTAGDVTRSFENALRAIRASAASCGVLLDAAAVRQPDAVRLELVEGGGTVRVLGRGEGAGACADGSGWYYVRDGIGLPARIELCPELCPAPGSSTRVQLRTSCEE